VAALEEVGYAPAVVSLGRDVLTIEELRAAVVEAARSGCPVLAGPLPDVCEQLVDLPIRLVGLSWGYDLEDMAARGDDLGWLARLGGLLVDSTGNEAIALAAGVHADRICRIPWGLDLGRWPLLPRSDVADVDGGASGVPLILSLRAHEPLYRIVDILRAFARLTQPVDSGGVAHAPSLLIGHSGSQTDELRDLAATLGVADRVEFAGTVAESELRPWLAKAACYVSAAAADGTSVTLLQAMASGTPVVASDTAGNRDWVIDGVTGYLFPAGDVDALSAVLQRVLAEDSGDVVRRARELVEQKADWHANLPRLRSVLEGS
jgi:glycosyltransferase involved in cell wall biosynthesis